MGEEWPKEKSAKLLREVYQRLNPGDGAGFVNGEEFAAITQMEGIEDTVFNCLDEINGIYYSGDYFAHIEHIQAELVNLNKNDWEGFFPTICRSGPPDFNRNQMAKDMQDPREFVASRSGAYNARTDVVTTESTVNDDLIPVDIFGKRSLTVPKYGRATEGADKAHLLPKARADALTWRYAAVAVLGMRMEQVNHVSTDKAILGCAGRLGGTEKRFPGIRNFLCNIVRMSGQQNLFDQNPRVVIFPALSLKSMRDWQGTGYDAIVLCENGYTAINIGMNTGKLTASKKATQQNVNDAMSSASLICKFLAHTVLQKTEANVNMYQKSGREREFHALWRQNPKVPVLQGLGDEYRPICRVSFGAHGSVSPHLHPAPDPMLLAKKSGNNFLMRVLGFRMVANADPPELDDLSEEGRQNLQAYIEYLAQEEQAHRHNTIMNMEVTCGPSDKPYHLPKK